jgi:hypothetical protein
MHDVVPLHFFLAFSEFLDIVVPEQWVGCNGPIAWTACSVLKPLDFLSLYAEEVSNVQDLQQ